MSVLDVMIIARKDLWVALHRRGTRLSLVLFPLVVAIGLSLVVRRLVGQPGAPPTILPTLLESFLFFFVVGAAVLPTTIAAYSLVGEKVERSLEPLLATPIGELDLLIGKVLAALVPAVLATWVGAALFIFLADRETRATLDVSYLPDATAWLIVVVVIPLTSLLSVLLSVLISVRATDVRSAQQAASLVVLPFGVIYVTAEIGVFALEPLSLLWLSLTLAVVDVVLLMLAKAVFAREEILTRWR